MARNTREIEKIQTYFGESLFELFIANIIAIKLGFKSLNELQSFLRELNRQVEVLNLNLTIAEDQQKRRKSASQKTS